MRSLSLRLAGVFLMAALPVAASAATTAHGPEAYLKTGDTPAAFICAGCILEIEDFEDNALDSFLTIDNGDILEPNSFSGMMNSVTDSVDGDDGAVDGNGNGGHSWFTGSSNSADRALTITFADPVKAAGLVFTDDLIGAFFVRVFVDEGNGCAKYHRITTHFGDVDDLCEG